MKEHAKKALKHDISVAGKTVPTLAIAALFLIGGGSAAILTSFGTVSGEADVDQPIQINGQNGASVTGAFETTALVGGESVEMEDQILTNSLNDTVDVSIQTEIRNGTDGDWYAQDGLTGISTSYLIYSQAENNQGDDSTEYAIGVEPTEEQVQEGDYATRVSSDGVSTTDYVTLWYPVETELGSSHDLTISGKSTSDVPAKDELYVLTADGTKYSLTTGGQTPSQKNGGSWVEISYDLDRDLTSEDGSTASIESLDVQAIGLGYGDGTALLSSGTGKTVEVMVDDVGITDSDSEVEQLSEDGSDIGTVPIRPTGTFTGSFDYQGTTLNYDVDSRYKLSSVTSFDRAIVPDSYKVETKVTP